MEKIKEGQEVENILAFEELIDSELVQKHQELIGTIESKTKISEKHPLIKKQKS